MVLQLRDNRSLRSLPPMFHDQPPESVQLNWTAILSFTGSVAVSLAIWVGLFRAIEYFTR